ncbi:MAG TPA: C69 family dipeptidase [Synergistaceae bacterium]|nr:C69 family dipeptidase [Synergistaceae bacterium]HQF90798.1 C69 family dipeptidase [Synergistaceae bacterium]HQH78947.1 C69 family dipeptidase [Synergistaceae bacterium]
MKYRSWLRALAVATLVTVSAGSAWACTVFMVGKNATVDGSVMTSHTCDGWYDQRVQIIPGGPHKAGEMVPIHKNICYQTRPKAELQLVGEIPQVPETYTYFHVGYPFMNEKSVVMGEYTWGGRDENLCEEKGWMMIEQLQALALQRAATARDAIRIMGELAEKYGYADGGEAVSVADKNGEVWLFEICGPGPLWTPESGKPGAIWVAQRIPDDGFAMGANRARIAEIEWDNKNDFMYSSNIRSFAQDMGWWKDGEPFVFHKIYNPNPYGSPYYQQRREWRAYTLIEPSLKLDPNLAEQYPLVIKPSKKLSVQDLMAVYRDNLEGTPYDLTTGLAAGPFGTPTRYATPKGVRPENRKGNDWDRSISLFRCSYSFVSQVRPDMPDPIAAVLWFGEDQPSTTLYMPIYAGTTEVPRPYAVGKRHEFDRDSAWWAWNFVGNWADLKFSHMIQDIRQVQQQLEGKYFLELPQADKKALEYYQKDPKLAVDFVNRFVNENLTEGLDTWWNLAWHLVGKYHDGMVISPDGSFSTPGYPTWWLEKVGFGDTDAEPKH